MRVYRRKQSKAQMAQARARLLAQKAELTAGSDAEINCQAMIDRYTELIGV
jgi:hypothetical protein